MANPGYAWASGDAQECAIGTFNPGFNTRPCNRCPGDLTTVARGTRSQSDCVAPPGHFYSLGKALPCGQGSYKDAAGNFDCEPCADGWSTKAGAVGAEDAAECACELQRVHAWMHACVHVCLHACPPACMRMQSHAARACSRAFASTCAAL